MINSIIRKTKKITLNDVAFSYSNYDKNIYRSTYFYNKAKFKHRKWKFLRSWKNRLISVLLKRFSPILKYMPRYSRLIVGEIDIDNIKINKFRQYLTYKSKLTLLKRYRSFFRMRTTKKFKKKFIYKHMTTHFNQFDTNFEMLLLRLGIVNNMKTARVFINDGILKINKHIRYQTHHLINFDRIQFSKRVMYVRKKVTLFLYAYRKYRVRYYHMYLKAIDHIDLLCQEASEYRIYHFLAALPFTFTINYQTMTFVYFNFILKNQWNYCFDFFTTKKFLQYGR